MRDGQKPSDGARWGVDNLLVPWKKGLSRAPDLSGSRRHGNRCSRWRRDVRNQGFSAGLSSVGFERRNPKPASA